MTPTPEALPPDLREALEASITAMENAASIMDSAKSALDRDIPLGDPVHEQSRRLTWPAADLKFCAGQARAALAAQQWQPNEWLVKVRRLVQGFEHVSGLARLWEPDYSSGSERALWARATEACADVAKLLNITLAGRG